jgi:vacuolar protein sorting-associated protein 16
MLDDSIRLLKLQESYDKDLQPRTPYIGLSVNETLFRLIVDSETGKSTKFQSAFKITDETFWNIKLRALVSSRRWDELRQWSQAKKPPIGYEVIALVTITNSVAFCNSLH